jgi:hypothetical protein
MVSKYADFVKKDVNPKFPLRPATGTALSYHTVKRKSRNIDSGVIIRLYKRYVHRVNSLFGHVDNGQLTVNNGQLRRVGRDDPGTPP